MVRIKIDQSALKNIEIALKDKASRMPRVLATAINKTGKKVRILASRLLKKELNVPIKVLKKAIKTKSKAAPGRLYSIIGMWGGFPIALKYFGARSTKKGVTYKIDPKYKVRSILTDAFIPRKKAAVYRRTTEKRKPIEQVFGPAPGTAFEKAGIIKASEKLAREQLPKEINEQIRVLFLDSANGLRGDQSKSKGRRAR